MATFDKISVDDFNRAQNKVADILGTGVGSYGYGQALNSGAVTSFNKVSVAGWTNLQYDMTTISRHQNGTLPTLPIPTANNKIKFNSTTEPVDSYELFVADLETNRFTIVPTSLGSTLWTTKSFTGSWNATLTFFCDINFPGPNNARHFFNMGGKIKITASRSGGTERVEGEATNTRAYRESIKAQNESWSQLLETVDAQFGGAATTLSDSLNGSNFYRCTNTYSNAFYTKVDDSPYQENLFRVSASTPQIIDNRNGGASYIQLRIEFIDGHKQINRFAVADGADGTFSVTIQTIDPTGRNYPSNTNFITYPPSSISVTDGIATTVDNYP